VRWPPYILWVDLTAPQWQGAIHPAWANSRPEVRAAVPSSATRVLDIGCSTGLMGLELKKRGHVVVGVEVERALAQEAREHLDQLVIADVEAMARDNDDPGGPFDCIVLADVLEHLRDPWAVVRWADRLLAPSGCMVISVPNVRHLETIWTLVVRRWWPYKDVGIFDRTHLRFFARENLAELLVGTSLEIAEVRRQYMLRPRPEARLNRIARFFGDFGTLQFIVVARPRVGAQGG
jgi:2-polyprenyl-3-methyl-5-hydroxy-6-metoxy-1,4-benzoquinol methylase